MKLTKAIKKQLFSIVSEMSEDLENNNGYTDVWSVLHPLDNPFEMDIVAEQYCDAVCNNGYFSRWTNFGQSLYEDCLVFQRRYFETIEKYK